MDAALRQERHRPASDEGGALCALGWDRVYDFFSAACVLLGVGILLFHARLADALSSVQDEYRERPDVRAFEARHGAPNHRRFNRFWYLGVGLVAVAIGVYGLLAV